MRCGNKFDTYHEGEKNDSHVSGYLCMRFGGGEIGHGDSKSLGLAILN